MDGYRNGYNGLVLKTCVSANEPTWGFESLTIRQKSAWMAMSPARRRHVIILHEKRYINTMGLRGPGRLFRFNPHSDGV